MKRVRESKISKCIAIFVAFSIFFGWDGEIFRAVPDAGYSFAQSSDPVIINKLTPDSGAPDSYVVIQGAGFSAGSTITFGGVLSGDVIFVSPNQIHARVPVTGLTAGFHDVLVNENNENSNALVFGVLGNTPSQVFADKTEALLPAGVNINGASFVTSGDIDGDRDPDLLVVDSVYDYTVYLLANDGSGHFTDASGNLPSISRPYAITEAMFGDIDGDSDEDILFSYSGGGRSLKLLLNNGSGAFTDAPDSMLPLVYGEVEAMDLGDADGDGDLDIILARSDARDALLINGAGGVFTENSQFNLPGIIDASSDIAFSDIDKDGDLDIITANNDITGSSSLRNRVYVNDGTGLFADETEAPRLPEVTEYTEALAAVDINRDGFVDLITANQNQNSVFLNNGTNDKGVFTDVTTDLGRIPTNDFASNDVAFGDMDGDGDPDVLFVGETEASLLFSDGAGYFSEDASLKLPGYESSPAPVGGKSAELADIDGDGDLDIIMAGRVAAGNKAFYILVNEPAGLPYLQYWTPAEFDGIYLSPGQLIQFGASAGNPIQGEPLTFTWFFNGNEVPTINNASSSLLLVIPRIGENIIKVVIANSVGSVFLEWHIMVDNGTNAVPVISLPQPPGNPPPLDLTSGAAISFSVIATDPDGPDEQLTYAWRLFDASGRLLTENNTSGSSFQSGGFAAFLEVGEYTIEVKVRDVLGAWAVHRWALTVIRNNPPTIDSSSPPGNTVNLTVGESQTFKITATDLDGDPLTYRWTVDGNQVGGNTNSYTYTAGQEGEFIIKGTVTDSIALLPTEREWTVTVLSVGTRELLDDIIKRAFDYFWNESDPQTGFARDRVAVDPGNRNAGYDTDYGKASIAATGFGLAALCIAAGKYGDGTWPVTPSELETRAELILDRLLDIQGLQATSESVWGKDGFFYHFVNMNDGTRWPNSEVSTIDTAILVAGALTAGKYFGGSVESKALQVYGNVNWRAFLDTAPTVPNTHVAANPNYNQMYHKWDPESSAFGGHWDYTDESMLLYLLAIASPNAGRKIPAEAFYSFRRELGKYGQSAKPMVQSWFGPLFVYQYTQAFFDFKNTNGNSLRDSQGVDWWENSAKAARANKEFCNDSGSYAGEKDLWGLTCGYTSGFNYSEYGAPPSAVANVHNADGTVFPAAAGGSIPVLPQEALGALTKMRALSNAPYNHEIWGDYGYVDSFKLGASLSAPLPNIADFYVGIDLGITLAMAENYLSGFVWDNFGNFEPETGLTMKNEIILNAGLGADNVTRITVDDDRPVSNFRMGVIDSGNPTREIRFDLGTVANDPYLLAIHTFMDKDIGDHTIDVNVEVNGTPLSGNPVTFEYLASASKPSLMKYIEIENSLLRPGAVNTVTLQWQGGANGAEWLAWHNIEISSPAANNAWVAVRDETADPKILFGNEYRIDDTYYAGSDVSTMEQALNKNVQNFTDLLFYAENTLYGALTIDALETESDLPTNVQVFANGLENMIFDGQLSAGPTPVIAGFYLINGWNRITLYHPGVTTEAASEWIRWKSLSFAEAVPPVPDTVAVFKGASFGKNEIRLRWSEARGAARYNVYRSASQGGPYTAAIATVDAPGAIYFDNNQGAGLQPNVPYHYVVRSVNENDVESPDSEEIQVTTGPYQLDYADGKDPNVFTGNTLDNAGGPLGENAYTEMQRYNGTTGKVRKISLEPNQKNKIGLANADISDATIFSFRVRGEESGEKFIIRLKDTSGGEADIALQNSVADIWQELHFYIADMFAGVNLSRVANIEILETGAQPITLYLDQVEFSTVELGSDYLDVQIKNREGDGLATGLSFGTNGSGTTYATSAQYIDVGYQCSGNWNIVIYTDNAADDAYPKFTGICPPGKFLANGLIGAKNSGYRVPMVWQVFQAKKYTDPGDEPPWGDFYKTGYIVDKSDWDFWKDEYSVPYRTILKHNADLGFPLDPDRENYHLKGTIGDRLYVYVGADFKGAPAQTYTTSKLTVDIYHD